MTYVDMIAVFELKLFVLIVWFTTWYEARGEELYGC